jgi:hypothetical protein
MAEHSADSWPASEAAPMPEEATPLIEAMLDAHVQDPPASRQVVGLVIGWLASLDQAGNPCVMLPSVFDHPVAARSLASIDSAQVGHQCACMFEQGDAKRPIIMGFLHHPVVPLGGVDPKGVAHEAGRTRISGEREIALHCGKASLHMFADGRIELRGTTVLSHASALNRIRGASVKIN